MLSASDLERGDIRLTNALVCRWVEEINRFWGDREDERSSRLAVQLLVELGDKSNFFADTQLHNGCRALRFDHLDHAPNEVAGVRLGVVVQFQMLWPDADPDILKTTLCYGLN